MFPNIQNTLRSTPYNSESHNTFRDILSTKYRIFTEVKKNTKNFSLLLFTYKLKRHRYLFNLIR